MRNRMYPTGNKVVPIDEVTGKLECPQGPQLARASLPPLQMTQPFK